MADLQVRHIDFWSLDVEGGELSVLQTFDFQQVRLWTRLCLVLVFDATCLRSCAAPCKFTAGCQVLVDVMVVETKESAHFDGIVSLLAANGFRLVERQVSAVVVGWQYCADLLGFCVTLCNAAQKMNTWFVREGFTPSVDPNLTTASQPASSPPAAA